MIALHRLVRRGRRQAAADVGFATRHYIDQAKALRERDMAVHKSAGLRIKDMVLRATDLWVACPMRSD